MVTAFFGEKMETNRMESRESSESYSKKQNNGAWLESHEAELIVKIIEHKHFQDHLNSHASDTCRKIVDDFIEKIRKYSFPIMSFISALVMAIIALVIYIFTTSTASINRLNDSVVILTSTMSGVEKTLAVIQTNQQNSKENIDKLNEKIYGK